MTFPLNHSNNQKLPFRMVSSSSEDPDHPLFELTKGNKGKGWCSSRFCSFPQEIIIQFPIPVHITQINLLLNEKKIPMMIDFYSYYNLNDINCAKSAKPHFSQFEKIGFVKPSNNSKSNFKARELRKIYVDTQSTYFKMNFHQNYPNKFNFFNQVSLNEIEFIGNTVKLKLSKNLVLEDNKENNNTNIIVDDEELDLMSKDKIKEFKKKMEEAIQLEDYDECKSIKSNIDNVRKIGQKIYSLNQKKKIMVQNEDFDTAKLLKGEIDKLKIQLQLINQRERKIAAIKEDIKENEEDVNKFNNVDITPNNNIVDKSTMLNSNEIDNSNKVTKPIENTNMNETMSYNQYSCDLSVMIDPANKRNDKLMKIKYLNISKSQKELLGEDLLSYDEIILPTILKKINPNHSSDALEESGIADKGELEPLDPNLEKKYGILLQYIGEDGLRMLFSKQILWKEEGFDNLNAKMESIFSDQKTIEKINEYIIVLMKMMIVFLEEKHPSIIMKTLDIFQKLLICIKNQSKQLNIVYDFNITDRILIKIKQKLGDVSSKIRNKTADLYCYMLEQDFCDYNNLISELIEEEINSYDNKRIRVTTKLTLGKLSIFSKVLDNVKGAFESKQTSESTFPYDLLGDYLMLYVNHSKSEVRKLTRLCISKFISQFGYQKLLKKLKLVEPRELIKLINENPVLSTVFPDIDEIKNGYSSNISMAQNNTANNSLLMNKSKPYSKKMVKSSSTSMLSSSRLPKPKIKLKPIGSKFKHARNNSVSIDNSTSAQNSIRREKCMYCQQEVENKEALQQHWESTCLYFINCVKCNNNIEVKGYNLHLLFECKYRKEFKQCKRCKEAIPINEYNNHVKTNNCNPVKPGNLSARCPLCHLDIKPQEKGFIQHLVYDKCSKHTRITF